MRVEDDAAQEVEAVAKQVMGLLAAALPHPLRWTATCGPRDATAS